MRTGSTMDERQGSQVGSIEERLAGTLVAVKPDHDFVTTLGGRMRSPLRPTLIDRLGDLRFSLMLILGILSLVAAVLLGAWRLLSGPSKRPAVERD